MVEETPENWTVSRGQLENGLPYTVRFREDLPEKNEITKLNTLVVVTWLFEPENDGMPGENELNRMERFENLMDEDLVEPGIARLMTVFTGDGVREWQFYTADEEIFMQELNETLADEPILPLEFEAFEDQTWDAYYDYKKNY